MQNFRSVSHGLAVAALVYGCLAVAGCRSAASPDVAATVNGRPIYYAEVDKAYKTQFPGRAEGENADQVQLRRLDVLRSLIDNELMLQRAEKAGLVATDADVDARLNELKAPYTKEEFEKQLKVWGLKLDELKARIRKDESVKKLFNKDITSKINISDADIANFYNANRGSFNLPEPQVHMAQILVTPQPDPNVHNLKNDKAKNDEEAKRKVEALETRLRQGEDFAMVAQSYSEDPATTPNGGDLGFLGESSLDKTSPDLRKLVLSLQPGQMSPVIRTPEGYRILKMISKEPAGQRDLSDPRVQQSIRETLLTSKDQLLKTAYYETARNEAKVFNNMSKTIFTDASGDEKFKIPTWLFDTILGAVIGGILGLFGLFKNRAAKAVPRMVTSATPGPTEKTRMLGFVGWAFSGGAFFGKVPGSNLGGIGAASIGAGAIPSLRAMQAGNPNAAMVFVVCLLLGVGFLFAGYTQYSAKPDE